MTKREFAAGLLAQNTDNHYSVLLQLDHDSFDEPIRVTHQPGGIVSNDLEYIYCPFDITIPSSVEGGPGETTLSIQNVDHRIGDAILALSGDPLKVTITVVTTEDPNYVEVVLPAYELVGTSVYGHEVSGTLTQRNLVEQPYGKVRVIPSTSPIWFR